jgi:hypothetical protein
MFCYIMQQPALVTLQPNKKKASTKLTYQASGINRVSPDAFTHHKTYY